MPFPIDGDNLRALAEDNPERWAALFREIDPMIREVTAWRKWKFDNMTREDVGQNIRLSIHRRVTRRDSGLTYITEAFLKSLAVNRCKDHLRRQIRRDSREHLAYTDAPLEPPGSDEFDPFREIVRREQAVHLRSVVEAMDPRCREAIIRYYFRGQTYAEISEDLDISINTVGSRLYKCLGKLRRFLTDEDPGEDKGPYAR